jgi:uncharacterized protein (TIGR02145 family)
VYTLQTALGGSAEAGGKMKESGLAHWNSPNVGATNSSGFTSIPGGYRRDDGSFDALESHGTYWTNSFINPTNCWYFYTYAAGNGCDTGTIDNNAGLSVRCVKN